MIEQRVSRLEASLADIKTSLNSIEVSMAKLSSLPSQADYAGLKADLARLDGRLSQLPTAWTMFTAIITTVVATWGAGAAIVFALLRVARP